MKKHVNGNLDSMQKIIHATLSLLSKCKYPFTTQEKKLWISLSTHVSKEEIEGLIYLIEHNHDPLGDAYCAIRSAEDRRKAGAIYTPTNIINSMLLWARSQNGKAARIIDAGAGSGRFILRAGKIFSKASLVGVESDPIAALILKANAAVLGLLPRLQIIIDDYRSVNLPNISGPTLFIGNPPYTRHHDIPEIWKNWFSDLALKYDAPCSKLAGLHIHFFAKTLELAKTGDYGAFITSAEWLDVNYGRVLRHMLTNGLGGLAIHVLSPTSIPFDNAQTTGAITCFMVGNSETKIKFRGVKTVKHLSNLMSRGLSVSKLELRESPKWSIFINRSRSANIGTVKLGDFFNVHRGQVTGCNDVFIEGNYNGYLPESILYPSVTKAHDLFNTDRVLASTERLRNVIDIPSDLSLLSSKEREAVERFIAWAKSQKAHESYIAKHRQPWWSVRLKQPAPILCTYMARRPPRFVRNLCDARHINVAHGLYPKLRLEEDELNLIINWLNRNVSLESGRTYAGGLTKFEPGEVTNILIPPVSVLREEAL